jgi:hypothetical protein
LYFDTDSKTYLVTNTPGEYIPELGDYLGKFTNEQDSGTYIEEFVSAGPKNYACRTNDGKRVCKVKGFSLKSAASEVLNFDSMVNIVKNQTGDIIDVNHLRFIRNKKDFTMRTEEGVKKYKQVYTKRILLPDLSTIP